MATACLFLSLRTISTLMMKEVEAMSWLFHFKVLFFTVAIKQPQLSFDWRLCVYFQTGEFYSWCWHFYFCAVGVLLFRFPRWCRSIDDKKKKNKTAGNVVSTDCGGPSSSCPLLLPRWPNSLSLHLAAHFCCQDHEKKACKVILYLHLPNSSRPCFKLILLTRLPTVSLIFYWPFHSLTTLYPEWNQISFTNLKADWNRCVLALSMTDEIEVRGEIAAIWQTQVWCLTPGWDTNQS